MAEPPIRCTLRQRRTAAGLSQGELAARVGVSRQTLIAVEAGRQVPSTGLALHLARALRCSVEDLFALPGGSLLEAALAPSGVGRSGRVAVGRIDGVWAAHPLPVDTHPGDGLMIEATPGGRATIEPLADPAALEQNVLVAGCAPLLGLLAGRLGRHHADARATWLPTTSTRALELLGAGLVHVAGLHLVEADRPGGHAEIVREHFPDQAMLIVNLTRWRQGFVVAPGNPLGVHAVEDLLRDELRFACRGAGAAAHKLVLRHLASAGLEGQAWARGPRASGHAEVARLVRWGVADTGVAIEAAALAEGLDFVPLSEERFDLLVPLARASAPPVARLLQLLDTPTFRAEAARLPGYDLAMSGQASTVAAS